MRSTSTKRLEYQIFEDVAKSEISRNLEELRKQVHEIIQKTAVFDMHTHLFAPEFGQMNLHGIDELLNYHYLVAELFRFSDVSPEKFWQMEKRSKSDLIWRTLFVENTPISEATRGVIAVLNAFGLDTQAVDLDEAREFFASKNPADFIDLILKIANVSDVVMTNDPLDEAEIKIWKNNPGIDSRFQAALRLDRLLNDWTNAVPLMQKQNYSVSEITDVQTILEIRRFLEDWIQLMNPVYLGVSLPDDFTYPEESVRGKFLREAVLPVCKEHGISLALMIGVRRQVNPALKLAGDALGRADVSAVSRICKENPEVKFLVTFLSRENQHELCVVARKFANLMPFGCWWFLNNPSTVREITAERFEMLGASFIPQHSDARVLDQLVYKWSHSRHLIAETLYESYAALYNAGRHVTMKEIERDVEKLFAVNFRRWVRME
jgi:hypothetical protein